eukprot:scaffold63416_cov47-Attheya_sp.AAC.1
MSVLTRLALVAGSRRRLPCNLYMVASETSRPYPVRIGTSFISSLPAKQTDTHKRITDDSKVKIDDETGAPGSERTQRPKHVETNHSREEDDEEEEEEETDSEEEEEEDTRTIAQLLGARVLDEDQRLFFEEQKKVRRRKSWADIWKILSMTWSDYKRTWVDTDEEKEKEEGTGSNESVEESMQNATEKIRENVSRNIETIQRDGPEFVEQLKKETGISTQEDLKRWAAEQMKLAVECLGEFMTGYRKGRDDEVDKMLNEYFVDLETTVQDSFADITKLEKKGADDSSGKESDTTHLSEMAPTQTNSIRKVE